MRITVIAKPNSKQHKIEVLGDHQLKVWIKSKPINGKANTEITQFLKKTIKKHSGAIPKIDIIRGKTSTTKVVETETPWLQITAAVNAANKSQ
jgi:uncharacterized protein (TIGR00251 family)|tara:strand:+ start:4519 stop:4797 length:279 start_codon:yes stop_codon:yes gene_type:complete